MRPVAEGSGPPASWRIALEGKGRGYVLVSLPEQGGVKVGEHELNHGASQGLGGRRSAAHPSLADVGRYGPRTKTNRQAAMEGPTGMPPATTASGRKALLASHATPWAQSPTAQEAPTSASPQTGLQSVEAAQILTSPPPTPAPRPRATPSLAAASIRRSTASAPATPSASRSTTFSPDPQTRSHESATDATQPFGMMRHARSLRAATASAAPRRAAAPHPISSTRASLPTWQGPLATPPPRRGGRRLPEGKKRCRGGQTRKTAGFARPCKRGQDAYDISPCTDGAKAAERPGIHERRPCEGPQETRQRLHKRKTMPQTADIPRRAEARTASPLAKYAEGDLFNMCDLEL